MILITDQATKNQMECIENITFYDISDLKEKWLEIKERLKDGESLFYLGTTDIDLLRDIWIYTTDGNLSNDTRLMETGANFKPCTFQESPAKYLYVNPDKSYAMHGIDDEPRMEVIPLLASYGKHGNLQGYPALFLKNVDKSLTGGNYKGSFWYIFSIENPLDALDASHWNEILKSATLYSNSSIYIAAVRPEYSLYYADERITINYCIENRSEALACYTVHVDAYNENGQFLEHVCTKEGAVTRMDSNRDVCYWFPKNLKNGVATIRLLLKEHNRLLYGERRDKEYRIADQSETAVLMNTQPIETPEIKIVNEQLYIDGKADFFIGTHLYPSANFFELGYRPVKVLELIRGIRAMESAGVRICRIWCDPVLDEVSIRGMETMIQLFAVHGIAVDFMIFSSWVHYMEIHTSDFNIRFEVAHMTDERLIGIYMHNIEEQKAFVATLVNRWNSMKHIVWDFSNEFSVVDPDERHLNVDFIDPVYKSFPKPYDNINLFEQWAMQIKTAIRDCKNEQPVIFGVSCWNTGTDNYRCSKKADLIAIHGYYPLETFPQYLYLSNSACLNKPQFMEEFGGVWLDNSVRAKEYDSRYHHLLGAGDSAGMNYEWGVLWLNDSLSGIPPYLKFKADVLPENLTDYVFEGRYLYGKSWPNGSTGVCPWMASFEYANTYGCMDYPSPTTIVMRHIANLGRNLGNVNVNKAVYLVLPFEVDGFVKNCGYPRLLTTIGKTIELLLTNGVNFKVWQEDMLHTIPSSAKVVIYPNELIIKSEQALLLSNLKANGVAVYTGQDETWLKDPNTESLKFMAVENAQVMIRDTDEGELILITTLEDDISTFSVVIDQINVSFGHQRNASLLWKNGLRQVDFIGSLDINNYTVAKFDVQEKSSLGKCLLRSNKRNNLENSEDVSIFSCAAGRLTLSMPYTKAEVLDIRGKTISRFVPTIEQGKTVIDLTKDDYFYEIRLTCV